MSSVDVMLAGGIGNQLFQIAAGYAYCKKYNKSLALNAMFWAGSQGNHPHSYKDNLLKNFSFVFGVMTTKPYTEKRFNYDEIPYFNENLSLTGYFQSIKYFEDYKDDFLSKLNWPDVNSSFISDNSVACHIRKGDYLQHHHIHLVCTTEYYINAMEMFPNSIYNIFTDDINNVKNMFKNRKDIQDKCNFIQTNSEIEDLYLIGQHKNVICSNSSFSWWGSLIGIPKDKIITPNIWFKNFENHDDIYRNEFTRIPV